MNELLYRLKSSVKPFLLHLLASGALVGVVACVVFYLWYPAPYRDLMGGLHLFLIVAVVDVICGPIMTAILFNPLKSRREIWLDLTLVVVIQISALAYGIYTVALARPVVLVFEVDRMVAVSAAQVDKSQLSKAPNELNTLSWTGPKTIGVRQARDADDRLDSLTGSLQGIEPSARPNWWQSYDQSRGDIKSRMQPLEQLIEKSVDDGKIIDEEMKKCHGGAGRYFYLPLVGQKSLDDWIVIFNDQADVVCFAHVGGFS